MEIGYKITTDNNVVLFKIDLIVWKLVEKEQPAIKLYGFKIDLIVWKLA